MKLAGNVSEKEESISINKSVRNSERMIEVNREL